MTVHNAPQGTGLALVFAEGVRNPAGATDWLAGHRDDLLAHVTRDGALVVRGLPVTGPADIATAGSTLIGAAWRAVEADSARTDLGGGVYNVVDGPPGEATCLHNLDSHRMEFPRLLLFGCYTAPTDGGATTLGDSASIVAALPVDLVARLRRMGWMLTRNYVPNIGVPWQVSFGTEHRTEVESYCRRNAIRYTWQAGGGLRTAQRRPAFVRHPITGEDCWFNNILYFTRWSMEPAVRVLLTETFGADALPLDTYLGDGTPLLEDDAEALDQAYHDTVLRHRWEQGDLLLVDNIRMAHGRDAFTGRRDVVVFGGAPVQITPSPLTTPPASAHPQGR